MAEARTRVLLSQSHKFMLLLLSALLYNIEKMKFLNSDCRLLNHPSLTQILAHK